MFSVLKRSKISKIESLVTFHLLHGDHGGQRLRFIDFVFEVPPSCPTHLPFLPHSKHPKQNWADSGTTKMKSTKPSFWPLWWTWIFFQSTTWGQYIRSPRTRALSTATSCPTTPSTGSSEDGSPSWGKTSQRADGTPCTVCSHRMAHRKWKETKQQPRMMPGPAVPGCCLVSFHFLWAILWQHAVQWSGNTQCDYYETMTKYPHYPKITALLIPVTRPTRFPTAWTTWPHRTYTSGGQPLGERIGILDERT